MQKQTQNVECLFSVNTKHVEIWSYFTEAGPQMHVN